MTRSSAQHSAVEPSQEPHPRAAAARSVQSAPPNSGWHARAANLWLLVVVILLPVLLNHSLWLNLWGAASMRGADASSHQAMAQIYDRTIFPETFGWTPAFFAGMPFPNFYPPLFYWCVALLHHTHLVSFLTAFKLLVAVPVLLLPAAVWLLAWAVSDKNRLAATCAALAAIPWLIDLRFGGMNFSYYGIFEIGLYTQPLGFVLLAAWYPVYLRAQARRWRFALSCLLLALTMLSNFFMAITAMIFAAATTLSDLLAWIGARDTERRVSARAALSAHLLCPLVAAGLTLFWAAPMLGEYGYLVTRPLNLPLAHVFSLRGVPWYLLAMAGFICWRRQRAVARLPFLLACLALAASVIFSAAFSPRWFPLQASRFLGVIEVLLAIPVGHLAAFVLAKLEAALSRSLPGRALISGQARIARWAGAHLPVPLTSAILIALALGVFAVMKKTDAYRAAFYQPEELGLIESVLRFGREHRDGRYLVEVPRVQACPNPDPDGRALSAYLGAQGNETLNVNFREASPNSLFLNPLRSALPQSWEYFGISSVLADDLDFAAQPLAHHLVLARQVGTKYLVIYSPESKARLRQEPEVREVHQAGDWSIFALPRAPMPPARTLAFRPALVVSGFSLKLRRSNEYDFIRLAEEQFADGWFDVPLVRAPERQIDRLRDLDQFGALILETYECADEDLAFARLREFARRRALILLSSDAPLFQRLRAAIHEFPQAAIIERGREAPGKWLEAEQPSAHYDASAIRREWRMIKAVLDQNKVATGVADTACRSEIAANAMHLDPGAASDGVPVLINTTYFPHWRRTDGGEVYAATPFFMLTFARQPVQLVYQRRGWDRAGLLLSIVTLLLLGGFTLWRYRPALARGMGGALPRGRRVEPAIGSSERS
jgi:hypothetical protein